MNKWELGKLAQDNVEHYIKHQLSGEIIGRNVRVGHLEIDLIARYGNVIAVIEVRCRSRSAYTTPFGSINSSKIRRIRIAGSRLWRRYYQKDQSILRMRFDVAAVSLESSPPVIHYSIAAL